jgi:hypothetical protein
VISKQIYLKKNENEEHIDINVTAELNAVPLEACDDCFV